MRYYKNINTGHFYIDVPHLVNGVWCYIDLNDQWVLLNYIDYIKDTNNI